MSLNGSRHYRVEHHTAYLYSSSVMLSHQQLHLTPRELEYQPLREHEVVIKPTPTQQREFIDAFGNRVAEIAIESAAGPGGYAAVGNGPRRACLPCRRSSQTGNH